MAVDHHDSLIFGVFGNVGLDACASSLRAASEHIIYNALNVANIRRCVSRLAKIGSRTAKKKVGVTKIAKALKRTAGATAVNAHQLGVSLDTGE